MRNEIDYIRIKLKPFFFVLFIFILALATPVLADYLGSDRTVATYEVKAVDYGVWARDNTTQPYCLDKKGNKADACSVCQWKGSPGNPCGDAEYSYKVGTKYETVAVTTSQPPATVASDLQNCTLQNGWCVTPPQLQITANEPLSGYQILLIEGARNAEQFACQDATCRVPLLEGENNFEYWALSSWGKAQARSK